MPRTDTNVGILFTQPQEDGTVCNTRSIHFYGFHLRDCLKNVQYIIIKVEHNNLQITLNIEVISQDNAKEMQVEWLFTFLLCT